jgi:exodeoxyribonuclease VII small subunit
MTEMKTFKEAYAVLQKHAQTLRAQQEPDIDNLTTIVSESLAAHKVCKERIDAVEKALEQSLGTGAIDDDSDQQVVPSAAAEEQENAEDGDIPF